MRKTHLGPPAFALLALACVAEASQDDDTMDGLEEVGETLGTETGGLDEVSETEGSGGDAGSETSDAGETAETSDTSDTSEDPGFGPWCDPPPACDAPAPPTPSELGWEHLDSNVIVLAGDPNHRVRDNFYVPGETQWLLGKFAYGTIDKDLKDEQVDVYVLRGCSGEWELLGEAWTTEEEAHATVEGVEDTGGWVYFEIPAGQELELGRHRVHMVVRGDLSSADGFIEVVEPGTPLFLSDIDGTLTTYESEEFVDLLLGTVPDARPYAAAALSALQDKGYHAMYLTARPEWLVERTREFLDVRGFPPGLVHTTLWFEGALGSAAETYKSDELERLADKGLIPAYVFGNTDSDAAAYEDAGIEPLDHRIFIEFDDPNGGRTIQSYQELIDEFEGLGNLCE
ncbi:phosphatidylinositol transfer protein [Pseudenhygromyxa sp. WMMC2535]|uniref:LNS2 domain-containing protein n=1 Tax=Pseudenhygromyxa sp. WMMC2535 TaxID=2712867 RepID=UPI00155729E3|nr:phosphatidylinositol transfer protein [Pseudenhygromyxa sp. WMMC2535]NVB36932.1 phosphatidylinositol transfer protein [Pseudenhygromyxa sp. WMMC2535]